MKTIVAISDPDGWGGVLRSVLLEATLQRKAERVVASTLSPYVDSLPYGWAEKWCFFLTLSDQNRVDHFLKPFRKNSAVDIFAGSVSRPYFLALSVSDKLHLIKDISLFSLEAWLVDHGRRERPSDVQSRDVRIRQLFGLDRASIPAASSKRSTRGRKTEL